MCLLWPAAGGRLASVGSLPIGRLLPLFVRVASLDTIRVVALCLVSEKSLEDGAKGVVLFFGDIWSRMKFWSRTKNLVADKVLVDFILCRDENNPMVV